MVLLAGVIALVLAIWTSPGMTLMRVIGVIGATLLIFFVLKDFRPEKK